MKKREGEETFSLFYGKMFMKKTDLVESDFPFCAHQFYEFPCYCGITGPCGSCYQIAVYNSFIYFNGNIFAACQCDIGTNCGICCCFFAFQNICSCQDLRTMADRSYGFICCEKFLYDFNYSGGQSQIFRGTTACDEQTFVISYIYGIKVTPYIYKE